jgi:hypothetical protein
MQKKVIRIIMGYGYRESCRELLNEIKILTLSTQYRFFLLLFVFNNRDYFVLIVYIITLTPNKDTVYTCLRYLWPFIKREFIIQV